MRNTVRDHLLDIQQDARKLKQKEEKLSSSPVTGAQLAEVCEMIEDLVQAILELADENRLTTT